jgi:hypothetical protein
LIAQAKTEAAILDTRLNALLLKAGELRQRLDGEEWDAGNKEKKITDEIANTGEPTTYLEKEI